MRLTKLLLAILTLKLFLLVFTQQTTADLIDNGDTTITDTQSGFMWLKYPLTARSPSPGVDLTVNWHQANEEISSLNTYNPPGGFSDWRLPHSPATGDTILRALEKECTAQGLIFGLNCWGPFDVEPLNLGRTFWTSQEYPAPGGDKAITFGTFLGRQPFDKSGSFFWAWAVRGGDVPDKRVLFMGQTGDASDGKSMILQANPYTGSIYRAFVNNPFSSGEAEGVTVTEDLVYILGANYNNGIIVADITVTDHWGITQKHFSVASLVDSPTNLEGLTRDPSSGLLILGYSELVGSGNPSKLLFVDPTNGSLVSSVSLVEPSTSSPYQVANAVGLDIDDQGNILVLTNDGRIQTYNPQGDHLLNELETEIFEQKLDTTLGLAFTGSSFLISGRFTDRIYRVDLSGSVIHSIAAPGFCTEALDYKGSVPGDGGGGGCSVSAGCEGNIVEFLLPYIGFIIVLVILTVRDARVRSNRIKG